MNPALRELISRKEIPGQTRELAVRWTDGTNVWESDGYNLPIHSSWVEVSQAIQLLVDDTDDGAESAIAWRWTDQDEWAPCAIHPVIPEAEDYWDEPDEDAWPFVRRLAS